MFDVAGRLARRGANLVLVVRSTRRIPRVQDVIGVIPLDAMGEAAVESVRPYAAPARRNPFPMLYRRRVVRPMRLWRDRLRGSHSEGGR